MKICNCCKKEKELSSFNRDSKRKGGNLVAHHLDGYNWCKEGRIYVNYGNTEVKHILKDVAHRNA